MAHIKITAEIFLQNNSLPIRKFLMIRNVRKYSLPRTYKIIELVRKKVVARKDYEVELCKQSLSLVKRKE